MQSLVFPLSSPDKTTAGVLLEEYARCRGSVLSSAFGSGCLGKCLVLGWRPR